MTELDLLCECISTEGEAEGGGVKFIYMDDSTVYRFENNRMKKIGKQLINRAKRELNKRNSNPSTQSNEDDVKPKKQKQMKQSQKQKPNIRQVEDDDSDDDNQNQNDNTDDEEYQQPPPPPKMKKMKQPKRSMDRSAHAIEPTIDLDEYYSNKHKMAYMTSEIDRLNSKIGKLKQYKSIVNKLTGGEIDDLPGTSPQVKQPKNNMQYDAQQAAYNNSVNDSLFMFDHS